MSCRVERLSGESSFDVHWLQRDINGNIIDHGRPNQFFESEVAERVLFGDHLINRPPSDAFLGEYWCQVVNTTTPSAPVYLGASNSIVIENYTFYGSTSECTGIIYESEIKCADPPPAISRMTLSTAVAISRMTPSTTVAISRMTPSAVAISRMTLSTAVAISRMTLSTAVAISRMTPSTAVAISRMTPSTAVALTTSRSLITTSTTQG